MEQTRRNFLKKSVAGTAGVAISSAIPFTAYSNTFFSSANEKINVALIGCRNHGFNILKHHLNQPNVECIALCDVDDDVLQKRTKDVEEQQGKKPKNYKDYRKLLENKDVDAVIIGTPDHWHCLQMIDAVKAGKDVYVEKPMANSVAELDVMVAAAKKYNRVVQVGQQQRSGTHWKKIIDIVQNEEIGKLRKIKVWGNFGYGIGVLKVPDSPVPAGVDFDMWLGPAPERTFNASRFHGKWRMFWDYGGGLMTDWGVHLLDMALWAKEVDYAPLAVNSIGGNYSFEEYNHETPDTLSVNYQMKDFVMTWDHVAGTQNGPYDKLYGLAFIGDNATIIADRSGWELKPEWRDEKFVRPAIEWQEGKSYHEEHVQNFLQCIRDRKTPNCPPETGRMAALYAHLGNMSFRAGETLYYDESKKQFKNSSKANELLKPDYRNPWNFPAI